MRKRLSGLFSTFLSIVLVLVLLMDSVPSAALAEAVDEAASSVAAALEAEGDASEEVETSDGSVDDDGSAVEDAIVEDADEVTSGDESAVEDAGDAHAAEDDSSEGTDETLLTSLAADGADEEELTEREQLDALAAEYADTLEDGTYVVRNNKSGRMVLDVKSGSTSNSANVQLYTSNGTGAQLWKVTHDSQGYVTFTCVKSGKVLDVKGASTSSGTNVQQYKSNGTYAQKWIVVPDDDGGYTILSALADGLALDVKGAGTSNGTNIQIYKANGTLAQSFVFVDADPDVAGTAEVSSIDEDAWYVLTPSCASKLALDITSGSLSSGADAQVYTANGTLAQLFSFEFVDEDGDGTGWYRIISACSGMALAIKNGDPVAGKAVEQYAIDEDDDAQLWAVTENSDGTLTLTNKASGLVLGVKGSSSSSGTAVQGLTASGSSGQKFTLSEQEDLIKEGTYTIKAAGGTSYVLDVPSASVSAGKSIQLYKSNSTNAQKWYISLVDGRSNTYTIESVASGKCLTAEDGDVVQRYADGGTDQMWTPSIDEDGIRFTNVSTGKVLDIKGNKLSSGTNVQVYKSNGTTAQRFRLSSTSASLSAGTYYICLASSSSKVIEVKSGSTSNSANVQLYSNRSTAGYQKWKITKNSDGTYKITNCYSGKVLDVKSAKAVSGTNVQQYTSNSTDAQKWKITYAGGGWKITSALDSSLVLDVAGDSTSNGTNVQIATSDGSTGQRFVFSSTSYSSAQSTMLSKAQSYSSNTKYLILVNRTTNRVGIYKGSKGSWSEVKYWQCTTGASSTPTPKGTFTTKSKGYSFGSSSYTCYYYTQFYGNYLFHSVLYYANTFTIKDGTLGANKSHGCVRLALDNAKWIYNNIPTGTKVVIY